MVRFSENTAGKVTAEFDSKDLDPANVRLIKSLNTLLFQLLRTTEEAEFFNNSAEVLRMCAAIIQQSKFPTAHKSDKVPYAHQALEFAMDLLQEQMLKAKIINYDN